LRSTVERARRTYVIKRRLEPCWYTPQNPFFVDVVFNVEGDLTLWSHGLILRCHGANTRYRAMRRTRYAI